MRILILIRAMYFDFI